MVWEGVRKIHRGPPESFPQNITQDSPPYPMRTPPGAGTNTNPKTRPYEKPDNHPQNDPSTRDILKILQVEATEVLRLTA